jgi:K+-sensing histidine kinase KdpD
MSQTAPSQTAPGPNAQLERELNYYRRECNDLGARLLRLQEEQSQAFREARRSRTTARLVREAYRLSDSTTTLDAIGGALLEVIVDNTMCDRAALMTEETPGNGRFVPTHTVGMAADLHPAMTYIASPPTFFFTTSQTRIEPPAYELTAMLKLPYVLWAYDPLSGKALILGNRSESNVSRPFESGDQELIEGALSVYLDVLTRKHAELQLLRAKKTAEETVDATAEFLNLVSGVLRTPLNAIISESEKMSSGSRYPLTIERCAEFADRINESGVSLVATLNKLLDYSSFAKGTRSLAPAWRSLSEIVGAATDATADHPPGVRISSRFDHPAIELHVDDASFLHALRNLVSNAVRSSRPGGSVDVSCVLQKNGALELGVRNGAFDASEAVAIDGAVGLQELTLPMVRAMVEVHEGSLTTHTERQARTVTILLPPHRVRVQPGAATLG